MADRSVVYRLRAEASQFQAQMKAAGASVKDAADKMTAADKEGVKFRKGLDSLGSTAGKVGLVAAAGLGAAIVKAADFDQAMSNVSAATGETAANMDKLRQAALDAGAQTAFSATEAADGIEQLAKAGVSTTDILNGGLMGALDLAAAGEIAVGEAAEVAAKAMTQFGLSGEQVPHIADLLASAAGNASGEVSDFGMALSQAGLVANQVGLSIEETTGGLAAFASAGLLGSDAGTSLKAALGALTPNSDKAAKTMSQLGISAFDAQGDFIGLAEFAGNLRESLATMTDEQRQATLETIFGSDAVRAASVLYEQGEDGIRKWINTVDDQGAAADMAGEKLDNLKGDLEALGGALETALIGTGDGSQGFLRGVTQGLTGAINKYNELPSAAQTATAAVLTGAAALGGSIWVGSKLVQGISNTRDALHNLGISGGKATKAMKGLAVAGSVAAGLVAVTAAAEGIRSAFDEALPGVEALTGQLLDLADTGRASALASEFDSIGASVDRLASKRWDVSASDAFGGILGVESDSLHDATREVEALDAALAGLVASAGPQAAAEAFTSLHESGLLTATQLRDLGNLLPQYNDAMAGTANESKIAAVATEQVGEAMAAAAPLTKEQAKALADARDAATKTATSFFNLGDSLNDAEKSLGQWINEMADQAEALRNFRINAEKAADNGLRKGLIAALKEAGPEGALRMRQLANATDAEIAKANKAWQAGQREIRAYVNETAQVPANKSTKLTVDSGPAFSAIAVIRRALKDIPDESVTVRVTRTGSGAVSPGFGPQANAAGGYITGPGTATSDSIPAYLSNGEYVIKAAAVEKYGTHMFDRLNAMHFADGGSVDRGPRRGLAFAPGGVETIRELNQFVRQQQRLFEAQREATEGMVNAAQEQRDAAKSTMDAAIAQRDAAGAAAVSAFEVDLFARSGNPWAAGAGGGPLGNLATSIAGLEQRDALIDQLSAQGLTGTALAALLAQGSNTDISGMISRGEIGQFAQSFAQYEGLMASVSASAGNAAFGPEVARLSEQFAAAERHLTRANEIGERQERKLDRAVKALERQAEEFADVLNGVASAGHRDRKKRGGR